MIQLPAPPPLFLHNFVSVVFYILSKYNFAAFQRAFRNVCVTLCHIFIPYHFILFPYPYFVLPAFHCICKTSFLEESNYHSVIRFSLVLITITPFRRLGLSGLRPDTAIKIYGCKSYCGWWEQRIMGSVNELPFLIRTIFCQMSLHSVLFKH